LVASTSVAGAARAGLLETVRAYVALTKPRIIELLLVTTVPAMVVAAGGTPGLELTVVTLVGGTLAAGSANALNCFIDRDIDAVMRRTAMRPLARRLEAPAVTPRAALVFGLVLGALSLAILWVGTNPLATFLTLVAIATYVVGYTIILKRRTPQNIVWGGAAGCMPVLIGWAAVTGDLAWAAIVMFLIVFFWTPPHFWALSMRFRAEYQAAGVPMLPVVATPRSVTKQMVLYSWAMVAASLILWPVAALGVTYVVSAVVLGAVFLREAHALARRVATNQDPRSMRLFHWSISYLSVLSLVIVLDVLVRSWL
jgi:protoheme IX farnesyltransferase